MVHGDGIKVIALEVDDVEKAWQATTSRGGKSAWAPREEKDDFGIYRTSAIYTYGETLHVFVDRADYKGAFAPTYKPLKYEADSTGLAAIDHIVGNAWLRSAGCSTGYAMSFQRTKPGLALHTFW